MDRNAIIGILLIFLLFIVWQQYMAPSPEEVAQQERLRDSLLRVDDSLARLALDKPTSGIEDTQTETVVAEKDSVRNERLTESFGTFSSSAQGEEEEVALSNDLFTIVFTNVGGRIKEVVLNDYHKLLLDEEGKEYKDTLKLLEDKKNKFEYFLPMTGVPGGGIYTSDLIFNTKKDDNGITFRAETGNGGFFEQKYSIHPETYLIDYSIHFEGLDKVISRNAESVELNWINYADKLELNTKYERNYSTVYYKPLEDDVDYISWTRSGEEELNRKVKWVGHSNQFFNTSLIASSNFLSGKVSSEVLEMEDEDLKKFSTQLAIPYAHGSSETFAMQMYLGPNEFDRLSAIGDVNMNMEDVIPFGWSIFGTINRWVIRPVFNFLSGFLGNKGIIILFLTLIVKVLLYPLTYKMLYSQSKMGALKPRLASLKEKFKDDSQKQQMENMRMYREFGVNPLGGCMPMVLQMPIWFALYRFFPASIEFRQASFLWATDLSSYDVFLRLPFEVPFGFGAHISLFTLLWAGTTLIYTYYNTKHMDMSVNPAMKYMQYLMPVFFIFFFNSFASGLTLYLLFSNMFNITQTIVTKNYIINNDKILKELEAYRKKPKKKKGFSARLETAMKEQQKVQQKKEQQNKKKRK
ncbi:MAG: membrane protein insertase YidC [Bacteroidetes bacterium]|nr:membrane protein insertase YidC [Bacteroidota bacterium]